MGYRRYVGDVCNVTRGLKVYLNYCIRKTTVGGNRYEKVEHVRK